MVVFLKVKGLRNKRPLEKISGFELLSKEDWKKPKQFNLVVMMKKIFQHLKIILPIILKKVEEYAILYE